MQVSTRRAVLRAKTAQAHDALDGMIGPFESPASYICYLHGMYAFRDAVEQRLLMAKWPDTLQEWREDRMAPVVARDLDDLGQTVVTAQPAAVLSLDGDALFGALYVLEGSALGARLLYRRAQALGYGDGFGARHLALQARQDGRWGAFLGLMEHPGSLDMEAVSTAAIETFRLAETAFERFSHEHA